MIIFKHQSNLKKYLQNLEKEYTVGFVPTMGALHAGHLSLIEASKRKCDVTVCSIFVNPTQFNNAQDLEKYPRTIERDLEILAIAGCDVLYHPEVNDVYIDKIDYAFDLGGIEKLYEAPLRDGHFEGVINICKRLFDIVKPNDVFFGQKDFQQCAVIKKMIRHYKMPIYFNECEIIRESDGLAMSSRNVRLSALEREQAAAIPRLMIAAIKRRDQILPEALGTWLTNQLNEAPGIKVDYAVFADTIDLKPALDWNWETVLLVACQVGSIRLLDNIKIAKK